VNKALAEMPGRRKPSKAPSTRVTLLARLRETRDSEAWRTFVDLYTPLVYRFCRTRGLQDADARDVTQQVLAIVHRSIGRFEYNRERGRFRNWLGAVSAHEISRHQRKDRRPGKGAGDGLGNVLAELESSAVDPAWVEEFNGYIFRCALDRVRPDFDALVWQAFDLTWLKDVKPRDAAELLGKPAAWIYKARYRVIERLRKELEFLTSDAAVFHKPA
jgi:RNA polymerase sigma-70 factor (ECF subfamily)